MGASWNSGLLGHDFDPEAIGVRETDHESAAGALAGRDLGFFGYGETVKIVQARRPKR